MPCLWLGPPGFNCSFSFAPGQYLVVCTVDSLSLFYLFLNIDVYVLSDDTSIV